MTPICNVRRSDGQAAAAFIERHAAPEPARRGGGESSDLFFKTIVSFNYLHDFNF